MKSLDRHDVRDAMTSGYDFPRLKTNEITSSVKQMCRRPGGARFCRKYWSNKGNLAFGAMFRGIFCISDCIFGTKCVRDDF